jgi:hypothetical protein
MVQFLGATQPGPKEKKKVYVYMVPKAPQAVQTSIDPETARAKKEHFLQRRQKKQQLHRQAGAMSPLTGLSSPLGGPISANEGSLNSKPNYTNDILFMGTCTNTGSSSIVFPQITAVFWGAGDSFIGTDYTYVNGGTNSKLTSSGYFTNALGPGETGFFLMFTSYDYSMVEKITYSFDYETYGHTSAMASLAFVGSPSFSSSYSDLLGVSGQVNNSSSAYTTYFTDVYFAIFGSDGKVQGVDSTYIIGSEYNYGSGTTDTALAPGGTGTFSNTFSYVNYADYSSYMNSFEWNEVRTSGLEEKDPPFGSFDTPLNGSTVASSIAVTGWALDDSGVDSVKIFRDQNGSMIYIGDAIPVEGARPDVAALYPEYPNNTQAGWGYMMLTNFLPGGGNGTFTLYAVATDAAGKTTTLGSKTILVDNANAVKPFGAIDTPAQGGTASGGSFINWGWVLTPQPKNIPEDGSTINVYVDGVDKGHPRYNIYRSDIAGLFPSYANSNGAVGYFYLDTTAYANGVHTIQWTATDNAGQTDGIGSRYFTISNTERQSRTQQALPDIETLEQLPMERTQYIAYKRGLNENDPLQTLPVNTRGTYRLTIEELDRVVLHLAGDNSSSSHYTGFTITNGQVSSLPVGSTLDEQAGIFYWSAGPGFRGSFPLVFIKTSANGEMSKFLVVVDIVAGKQGFIMEQ